jgi:Zn-dependent protease
MLRNGMRSVSAIPWISAPDVPRFLWKMARAAGRLVCVVMGIGFAQGLRVQIGTPHPIREISVAQARGLERRLLLRTAMASNRHESENHRHRWAWRLGSLTGISIYVHATFVLLLAWLAMSHLAAGHDLALATQGLLLVVCVFAVVVIHELSHALVARRFGIATRDITLYPIGGVARLERMPERPAQELLVALAGPATNVILALALYVGLRLAEVGTRDDPLTIGSSFAVQLMWINLSLGIFNLLPAFPMDGGRILRATLAFWMDRPRATAVAARVGRGIAIIMGIVGLLWSPMLAVIAVFVWMAAGHEATMEGLKALLHGASVEDAMVGPVRVLPPETSLNDAASQLASGFQHDFPVVDSGRVVGMLTRNDVLRGLATRRPDTPIAELMHTSFPIARPGERLETVLERLPQDGGAVVVVRNDERNDERNGEIVGLLDPEHLGAVAALRGGTSNAARS